jgi:hypothetical protein
MTGNGRSWSLTRSRALRAAVVAIFGLTATAQLARADESPPSVCVNALEQVAALQQQAPAYKQLDGEERHYLDDADRAAEIARLQATVTASCSAVRKTRAAEEAAAQRLLVARSPLCAIERDKLSAMQSANSREPADSIEAQRKLVTGQCPVVEMRGVWLLQMLWLHP